MTVYNRTASKAAPLAEKGAKVAERPVDVVTPGGIVISVLWDAEAVESVVAQDGFLERLGPGGVHISMCTGLPEIARRLAALHSEHGVAFVEAPIFGQPPAAVARKLAIPYTGPAEAKARIRPVLEALGGANLFDFGEQTGAATVVKLVGNFLIISAGRSIFEGLSMAREQGVDPQSVIDMLTQTLFPTPIYQLHGRAIASGRTAFTQTDIPVKDLGIFREVAGEANAPIASFLRDLVWNG